MYKLFSNCFPIKGYTRAIIYDTQRFDYSLISTKNHSILRKKVFKENEFENAFFNLLLSKEYIFSLTKDEINYFPELELAWKNSSFITNLVIHENNIDKTILVDIIKKLNIKAIGLNLNNLSPLITIKLNNLDSSLRLNTACTNFIIKTETLNTESLKIELPTFKIIKTDNPLSCIIHNPNLQLFTESQTHHTYFNRKMYIGAKGEIKNAPECEEEFGNINDLGSVEDLKQIIAIPEFQKYWFVHKELCDVCKDCEFRHMCVDNRLPYQRKDGSWYHKTECNYNPYICKWKDEEGYRTLEECGVVSNEKGFSINHEKITAINKTLWEEETENA